MVLKMDTPPGGKDGEKTTVNPPQPQQNEKMGQNIREPTVGETTDKTKSPSVVHDGGPFPGPSPPVARDLAPFPGPSFEGSGAQNNFGQNEAAADARARFPYRFLDAAQSCFRGIAESVDWLSVSSDRYTLVVKEEGHNPTTGMSMEGGMEIEFASERAALDYARTLSPHCMWEIKYPPSKKKSNVI